LRRLQAGKEPLVRTLTAVIVALMLAVAGCGGDSDSAGGETTDSTSSQSFAVSASDFTFSPPTFSIDAPGSYTFDVTNDGGVDHALEIEGNGIEEETETIAPGESASVTVDLEAGMYEMYCPIGNHRDLGMTGEVTVSG
jgi:uncharacterized cupredoxin-like copper-binding protein